MFSLLKEMLHKRITEISNEEDLLGPKADPPASVGSFPSVWSSVFLSNPFVNVLAMEFPSLPWEAFCDDSPGAQD